MSRHILVDQGALQMLKNAVERIAEEQGRPVLLEMVEEVNKSCINVSDFKLVDGPYNKRAWVEDKVYGPADLDPRYYNNIPKDVCKETKK